MYENDKLEENIKIENLEIIITMVRKKI